MKKCFISIAIAFLVFAGLSSCSKKSGTMRSVEEIQKSGVIRIAVFRDGKPFGYIDEHGEYRGYDVYFGDRLAKDLSVKVKYISVKPTDRINVLASGTVDIVLANFTRTWERAQKVDFALPYMKVALGIVSPDDALITEPEQLVGKKLIVTKGTTAETYFSKNHPDIELLKFDGYPTAYDALLDGSGNAMSTDNVDLLAWAIENPGFTVGVSSLGNIEPIAPAVQKGNTDLLNWLNKEIKTLGKENFFHVNYEATLRNIYGLNADADSLVVEGGEI